MIESSLCVLLRKSRNQLYAGASFMQIEFTERSLGVMLPRVLKDFLFFSNGAILSKEICIYSTRQEKTVSHNNLDNMELDIECLAGRKVLVFGQYYDEDMFCYICEDLTKDDPVIFLFDHESNTLRKDVDCFSDFIRKYSDFSPPGNRVKYLFEYIEKILLVAIYIVVGLSLLLLFFELVFCLASP